MDTTTTTVLVCGECGTGNYRPGGPYAVCTNPECPSEGMTPRDFDPDAGEVIEFRDGLLVVAEDPNYVDPNADEDDDTEFNEADWKDRALRTGAAHLAAGQRVAVFGFNNPYGHVYNTPSRFHVGTVEAVTNDTTEFLSTEVRFTDGTNVYARDYAVSYVLWDHEARPDDDAEPGDRCRTCGANVFWAGPGQYDWLHMDDPANGGPAEQLAMVEDLRDVLGEALVAQIGDAVGVAHAVLPVVSVAVYEHPSDYEDLPPLIRVGATARDALAALAVDVEGFLSQFRSGPDEHSDEDELAQALADAGPLSDGMDEAALAAWLGAATGNGGAYTVTAETVHGATS